MNNYLYSICIPTFNRITYLKECLSSVLPLTLQRNDIQVVVSDNGSSDNTSYFLFNMCREYKNFKVVAVSENLGFKANFMSVLNNADGEYITLLGDDDIFVTDELLKILEDLMSRELDVALFDRFLIQENSICGYEKISTAEPGKVFEGRGGMAAYLKTVVSTSGLFGFISNIIIRRQLLERSPFFTQYNDNDFPHTIQFMNACLSNDRTKLVYFDNRAVAARAFNARYDNGARVSEDSRLSCLGLIRHFACLFEIADFCRLFSNDVGVCYGGVLIDHYLSDPKLESYRHRAGSAGCLAEFRVIEDYVWRYKYYVSSPSFNSLIPNAF